MVAWHASMNFEEKNIQNTYKVFLCTFFCKAFLDSKTLCFKSIMIVFFQTCNLTWHKTTTHSKQKIKSCVCTTTIFEVSKSKKINLERKASWVERSKLNYQFIALSCLFVSSSSTSSRSFIVTLMLSVYVYNTCTFVLPSHVWCNDIKG